MHIEAMTPQAITQELGAPLFFVYDWYRHPADEGDQRSLARGYRISDTTLDEVLEWLHRVPPVDEPGFAATSRELYALVERSDRPGEFAAAPLLTRTL
ncbi:hypothetical protein ACPXCG_17755 [Gordonia sp. DT218]|uniref:hypothetical protein n=1 Tax=Gordonia sp. DT218 TaxID=3416659 RepID=UPI003CE6C32A